MVRLMPEVSVVGKSSDHTSVIATSRCDQDISCIEHQADWLG